MKKGSVLKRFGVSMEDELLRWFDGLCRRKGYASRSEAIRDMVRDLIVEEEKQLGDAEVVGTVTVVYDHHQREFKRNSPTISTTFLTRLCRHCTYIWMPIHAWKSWSFEGKPVV